MGGRLLWRRAAAAGAAEAAQSSALVLHLAHLAAPARIARTYQAAYAGLGLDTLSVLPPPLLLWFPRLALRLAVEALEALAADFAARGPRPVLIAAFSGAPKVSTAAPRRSAAKETGTDGEFGVAKACLYKLLHVLSGREPRHEALGRRLRPWFVGTVFDSGPVDFTSSAGTEFLKPSGPPGPRRALAAGLLNAAAAALDLAFLPRFERERREMWLALECSPVRGPALFLFSEDDRQVDVAAVERLIDGLRLQGREVLVQRWQRSAHVAHLRHHKAEYLAAWGRFLRAALAPERGKGRGRATRAALASKL